MTPIEEIRRMILAGPKGFYFEKKELLAALSTLERDAENGIESGLAYDALALEVWKLDDPTEAEGALPSDVDQNYDPWKGLENVGTRIQALEREKAEAERERDEAKADLGCFVEAAAEVGDAQQCRAIRHLEKEWSIELRKRTDAEKDRDEAVKRAEDELFWRKRYQDDASAFSQREAELRKLVGEMAEAIRRMSSGYPLTLEFQALLSRADCEKYMSDIIAARDRLREENAWVRTKLGLPETATIQDVQGALHVWQSRQRIFAEDVECWTRSVERHREENAAKDAEIEGLKASEKSEAEMVDKLRNSTIDLNLEVERLRKAMGEIAKGAEEPQEGELITRWVDGCRAGKNQAANIARAALAILAGEKGGGDAGD